MGRPFFSSAAQTSEAPAVRVETEPAQPACERWTYWNPFDPDSEEFFSDAEDERIRTLDGPVAEAERPRRMIFEDMNSSSSESDGTESGRETPVFVEGDDGPSVEELSPEEGRLARTTGMRILRPDDERHTYRANLPVRAPQPPPSFSFASRTATSFVRTPYNREESSPRRSSSPQPQPQPQPHPIPRAEVAVEPILAPRPVSTPAPSAPITIPARPSTPPSQAAWSFGTPSPAPSITPRLYTWRTIPAVGSPGSPLPNRSARMSVTHISPSAITVQRVLG
ncbi:hypothetical protein BC629DRAFT_905626 [Irpex lacteus]|nr:hypothetical protein BC629DRAFT_905626 [Irpex lacteus]